MALVSMRASLAQLAPGLVLDRKVGVRALVAALLSVVLLGVASPASAQEAAAAASAPAPVLTDDQLFKKYVISTVGPPGMIGAAAAAGYEQYENYPRAWQPTAAGYAKRWASAYAAGAIGNSTKYAVAHALHQDPSFAKCRCSGFNARMRHAVLSVFTARQRGGREVFSVATVTGLAAEHAIPAALWFPREDRWKEGAGLAGVGIAAKIGISIFREFVGRPKVVFEKP
jgi:hypothetical protein